MMTAGPVNRMCVFVTERVNRHVHYFLAAVNPLYIILGPNTCTLLAHVFVEVA